MSDQPREPDDTSGAGSDDAGRPDGPPSPTRPPTRSETSQNMVPMSAGEPPSWIPPGDANRPDAPDPVTWATPPYRSRPEPGLRWEPREPEKDPKRVSTLGITILAVAIVVAAVVIGSALYFSDDDSALPDATPTPSTDSGSGERSEEPGESQGPTAPPPSESAAAPEDSLQPRDYEPLPSATPEDPIESTLQANPLYAATAPPLVDCPAPTTVETEQEWRDIVRAQWTCIHQAWVPYFEEQGVPTNVPEVNFYPGDGSKSDCGYFEAPAFYCGEDGGSVFFGGAHFTMAQDWDLSINEMVNHEYSHHLQMLTGISAAWSPEAGAETDDEAVRRSELQAVCWSGMFTRANESVNFDHTAMQSWQHRLETMLESETHGSRPSMLEWGNRGLYAETLADCNTWVVDSDGVR